MKTNDLNLKDHRYGKLLVVEKDPRKRAGRTLWLCRCDCGAEKVMQAAMLVRGLWISCGCEPKRAHVPNMHRSPEELEVLRIYRGMIARCTRPWLPSWSSYGGRGISVCKEWMDNFEAFYAHIGPRPSGLYSIDRIDNDGNYEPGNVRWATRKEQQNNRRPAGSKVTPPTGAAIQHSTLLRRQRLREALTALANPVDLAFTDTPTPQG